MTTVMPQKLDALAKANRVRIQNGAMKREIAGMSTRDGRERVADLLERDGDTQAITVGTLLCSISFVGASKVRPWLRAAGIGSTDRRVRDLTERQRVALAGLLRAGR